MPNEQTMSDAISIVSVFIEDRRNAIGGEPFTCGSLTVLEEGDTERHTPTRYQIVSQSDGLVVIFDETELDPAIRPDEPGIHLLGTAHVRPIEDDERIPPR